MKKRILLLGGFGFIGSNILSYIDLFMMDLYEVIVFDKFKYHHNGLHFNCVKKVYDADFSDSLNIETIFRENEIDIVLHSLSTTVPATSNNIRFDIESNVIPTIELLNIMVKYNVKKIVYISSGGAIYGNNDCLIKHNENDIAYPVSSYGIVKLTIEKYLHQYSYLYDIDFLILRLSNPYGKFHYSTKQGVINVATRSAFFSTPFSVWGDGYSEKDYIYIDDFCDILFKIINKQIHSIVLNIGSGNIITINSILQNIKAIIPSFTWTYRDKTVTDVDRFELDLTNLLGIIGDYSFTPFPVGLEKTINWLKLQYK